MSFRFAALVLILCGQSLRSLARHKGRTALSAIGIAIAIAAVVWVVALGRAGAERATALLQDLGDNLVWVEAGSRNVAGVRTGAKSTSTLTLGDADAIARDVKQIENISPQIDGTVQLVSARSNWTTRSRGIAPAYLKIKRFALRSGEVFTDEEVGSARNVLLMGETVRAALFGDEDALSQPVRTPEAVSLLVGGIGIMNVMLASVSERTHEIGVRLAVGATSRAITLQFLVEAVVLSMLGGTVGLAISVAGASALARAVGWSLTIPPESFVVAFAFSAAVGIVFGYIPARRAAQLDPIKALRSD